MKPAQVLLLTSDRELRALLREAVAEMGAVADVASDVSDALEKVCRRIQQIDVALIDFQHCAHGMRLLNAVRSCRVGLPVIALIEHGDKQIEALAYATGATRCLPKPLTKYLLTTAICDLLQPTAYSMAA
jgi:DNA-binding NtrC family response regulator